MKETIRYCKDIGMFAIDRSRLSCKFASEFCMRTCFNVKLERAFGHAIGPKDVRNDLAWHRFDINGVKLRFARAHKQTKRARLMTRGEACACLQDIGKVEKLLQETPDTKWWIPTRAWTNRQMRDQIEKRIMVLPNARVMASLDPSYSKRQVDMIKRHNWSTMFYGEDEGNHGIKCPKTFEHKNGYCAICRKGCFSKNRVDVHLKQH